MQPSYASNVQPWWLGAQARPLLNSLNHPQKTTQSPQSQITTSTTMASDSLIEPPAAEAAIAADPSLGFTEIHGSLTYLATADPCLDFFHVVPDTPAEDTVELLEKAWHYCPLTTLKLVFNLRGIRGTGKSIKKAFFPLCPSASLLVPFSSMITIPTH